ncbi:hypothetical protein CFK38_15560 [Brachybacterium vulturis]|uniref:DUF418 domain-containing protein n=1 Tax=Brachybacterium vulturis TaxID=2017484 RepID=A0A291GS62_9MICO|nr:DUF418 domain-containing protein [Brachybacterium vulturis]ATG52784.1 hypothetical protein CFK38_15560 [Brachybacterium vulturis]
MTASVPLARRAGGPDLARGVSLLGIALANMVGWLHGREWTVLLKQREGTGPDRVVDVLIALLADNRGFPLFAMLFGYGIGVLYRRSRDRGQSVRGFLLRMGRRHLVLLGIGLAHAILLFSGDILIGYAIVGMFVVLLISRHRVVLPLAGVLALPALGVWGWIDGTIGLTGQSGYAAASAPTYLASLEIRAGGALREVALAVVSDVALLAPMALGAIAARIHLLEQVEANRDLLRPMMRWGLLIGLLGAMPLTAVLVLDPAHAQLDSAVVLGALGVVHQYSGLAGALGLAAAAALLAERVRRRGAQQAGGSERGSSTSLTGAAVRGIEALGTVSLSVYIAQSVLYLALFPPYTLDLGARLGSAGTAGIAVLGWLAMIPLAVMLHRHGRRGPLEVVLRRLAGSSTGGSSTGGASTAGASTAGASTAGSATAAPQRVRPEASPSEGAGS